MAALRVGCSSVPEPFAVKSARPVTAMRPLCSRDIRVRSKLSPVRLKPKSVTRRVVRGAAGDLRFVVGQLNVLEFGFLPVEIQVRTEALNRFAVNTAIAQHHVALSLRSSSRPCYLQMQVHCPGNRVRVPCQRQDAKQIRILGIQVRPYRAGITELPLVELHMEIKSDRIRVAAQSAVARGKNAKVTAECPLEARPN